METLHVTQQSNVVALPVRTSPTPALELQLLGALLHLASVGKVDKRVWETLRLTGEEFATDMVAKAWKIAGKQVWLGNAVSATTVFTAGFAHKWFTTADVQRELTHVAEANTLTVEAFRSVAKDFRLQYQAQQTANQLEAMAHSLRTTAFDPAKTAGLLAGIERGLHATAARIEDLTGAQMKLMHRWDTNRASNRKDTVATGIKVLDAEIGGLPRMLCVLAADAGVGKTALLDSMIHSMLKTHWDAGLHVGLISPEDGVEHVVKRWLARETGWLLRDIGSRELDRDDDEKLAAINAEHYELLKRVHGCDQPEVRADDLISMCWQMVDLGAGVIAVDNFNKIDLGDGPDYPRRVLRFANRLAQFCDDSRVPVVMVTHMNDGETNTGGKITATGGLQGGRAMGRVARFRIDLHRKGKALRGVIAKANELCEQGTTVEFTRQATAGLIDPDTGVNVDLAAERAQEAAAKRERQEADRLNRSKKQALQKAEAKMYADEKIAALKAAKAEEKRKAESLLFAPDEMTPKERR